jgi:general secretion pathway protein I
MSVGRARQARFVTCRREGGFTLLEILLAFVVFALSFAVVLEIIAGSVRSTIRARDYSEVALHAQSLMELVGTEFPLEPGAWQGEADGGYRWTLEVLDFDGLPDDQRTLELAELNNTVIYWVVLRLEWGDGRRQRQADFSTLRSRIEGGSPGLRGPRAPADPATDPRSVRERR